MSDQSSSASAVSSERTAVADDDPRHCFQAFIADINFRGSQDGPSIDINDRASVYRLVTRGPNEIMEGSSAQVRWINIPANNMAWIEELMTVLDQEQQGPDDPTDSDEKGPTKYDGVLRPDLWRKSFHGRHSKGIHCRFMAPLAARYSSVDPESPDSDDSDPKMQNANVVALHMPYLHWESYNSWKDRNKHIAYMKQRATENKECDCVEKFGEVFNDKQKAGRSLLHSYLLHNTPLHDRRTLDQSYFYNLRYVEHKDQDQIIGMHTRIPGDANNENRKMMMTDQLWMWVIDKETIITSLPRTGNNRGEDADVLYKLQQNITRSVQQGAVKSIHGLMAFIIDHCTGVFHSSDIEPKLEFFQFFADVIGETRDELDRLFHEFRETSQHIEDEWTADITTVQMSRKLDELFSIKEEIKLLERVEKIMSDLAKIDFICKQQEDVLRSLLHCCRSSPSKHHTSNNNTNVTHSHSLSELFETVSWRRNSWADMALTARSTHDALHSLLDLKQRQAAVSEARSVRYQVEMTAQQGQSIMLLTTFTVFFLPVSVMAAIFGMNLQIFVNDGKIQFSTMLAITVPTTVTLVVCAFAFAFFEQSKKRSVQVARAVTRSLSVRGDGAGLGGGGLKEMLARGD